jgi:hypothetical protein
MKLLHVCIASISAVASVSAQNYTANDCFAGFGGLGFNLTSFERYDDYFTEDSVMTLAQAGNYIGPVDIEEYVRFVDESSPYFDATDELVTSGAQLKGISDDGTCDFLIISSYQYSTNASKARASIFNLAIMFRIFYKLSDNNIPRLNVFFSQPAANVLFGNVLNTGRTRNFICDVIENECPETYTLNNELSTEACSSKLETLPILTGDRSYFDGDSQGCRALHGVFASQNSKHCAHLSFVPQTDTNGDMKCQDSAEIAISDLFDPQDLVSYDSYVQSPESLIETLDGYLVLSMEEEESLSPSSMSPEEPSSTPNMGDGDSSNGVLVHHPSVFTMILATIACTFLMP